LIVSCVRPIDHSTSSFKLQDLRVTGRQQLFGIWRGNLRRCGQCARDFPFLTSCDLTCGNLTGLSCTAYANTSLTTAHTRLSPTWTPGQESAKGGSEGRSQKNLLISRPQQKRNEFWHRAESSGRPNALHGLFEAFVVRALDLVNRRGWGEPGRIGEFWQPLLFSVRRSLVR
jgi:hypothetical protein